MKRCRTCQREHVRRVWCVAPGCRWAGYRSELLHSNDDAKPDTMVSPAELVRDRCPWCRQGSVRLYRPSSAHPGQLLIPGSPAGADDALAPVAEGGQVRARRRVARRRARAGG